jgi:hypothetical protein
MKRKFFLAPLLIGLLALGTIASSSVLAQAVGPQVHGADHGAAHAAYDHGADHVGRTAGAVHGADHGG